MRDHFGSFPLVSGMGFSRGVHVLDDCEGTLTWIISGTGGDDVHEYATVAAWQGAYGLRLKTRVTATAENDYVAAQKIFDHPYTGFLLMRLRLATPLVANCKSLSAGFRDDDGAQQYLAQLALYPATGLVKYCDAAGAYVAIDALAQTFAASSWLTLEIAIDCLTHKWLYVLLNGVKVDLSTISLYNDAATASKAAQAIIMVTASAAGAGEAYLDNILVTEWPEA